MRVLSANELQIHTGGNLCSVVYTGVGAAWGVASASAATGVGMPLAIVSGIFAILGAALCDDTPSGPARPYDPNSRGPH